MARPDTRPYLIGKDEEGQVRLTVRETRYNMQNYPIVTGTLLDQTFRTATAARAYAKEHYGAEPGEFVTAK
jgi:hypothetical protein